MGFPDDDIGNGVHAANAVPRAARRAIVREFGLNIGEGQPLAVAHLRQFGSLVREHGQRSAQPTQKSANQHAYPGR